jgi:hypothetical protein
MADPIDLDHLRRLLDSATPGPWEADRHDLYRLLDAEGEAVVDAWSVSDVALIAALVSDAPALLDEVERLRAEVASAREEGRAEERAAIVRWMRARGDITTPDAIDAGEHREEAANA